MQKLRYSAFCYYIANTPVHLRKLSATEICHSGWAPRNVAAARSLRSSKNAANGRQYCFCKTTSFKSAILAFELWERIMRTLLSPALGLALALALAAPTVAFAHTTSSGSYATGHSTKTHTTKMHSKACHPTKTHHCKTAQKSTKKTARATY